MVFDTLSGNVSSPLTSPGWQLNKTGEKRLLSGVVEKRVRGLIQKPQALGVDTGQVYCCFLLRSVSFVVQVIARTGITMWGRR